MRTTELKNIILKQFPHQEFYGYEVHKSLASAGIEVEISRLYRVLTAMLKEQLLESRWTKSRTGPKKRMYRLSDKGRDALNDIFLDAVKTVHAYYGLYLRQLIPRINVFAQIYRLLTNELNGDEILVFITREFTPIHEMVIQTLHRNLSQGKIYLIKPDEIEVDLNLANLLFLDGNYHNIPLKTDYVNCMIVINLPKQERLNQALQEWHRVLTKHGTLAILTPTVLIEHYDDPLTIGDFIEKHEHETIEHGIHIDKEHLEEHINRYFATLEATTLVHMTVLRVSEPKELE